MEIDELIKEKDRLARIGIVLQRAVGIPEAAVSARVWIEMAREDDDPPVEEVLGYVSDPGGSDGKGKIANAIIYVLCQIREDE